MYSLNVIFLLFLSLIIGTHCFKYGKLGNTRLHKPKNVILFCSSSDHAPKISNNDKLKIWIPAFAALGTIETTYLTWIKLTEMTPLCGSETCADVLSGPFSTIPFTNLPISLIGILSYGTVLFASSQTNNQKIYGDITLFITTAMATFSGYFMYLLVFVLQTSCNFCYASAIMSCSMAIIAWQAKVVPNLTRAFSITTSSALLSFVTSIAIFYTTNSIYFPNKAEASVTSIVQASKSIKFDDDDDTSNTKKPPLIKKESSKEAMKVANLLKQTNAKMYGAYWCSHCFNQKNELGMQAYEEHYYQYIECDKEGYNSQYPLCRSNKVCQYIYMFSFYDTNYIIYLIILYISFRLFHFIFYGYIHIVVTHVICSSLFKFNINIIIINL